MSSNLATQPQVPAYILACREEGKSYKEDFGHISPRDIRAPFLKLVHGMSKEAKPGWGPMGNEPPMGLGVMFLSHTHEIIPPNCPFIPLLRSMCYIKWENQDPGSRMLAFTMNENDPQIIKDHGLEFREDPNTGNREKPLWDTYVNFYVLTPQNMDQPVVLSFYRTALKSARAFTNLLIQATSGGEFPLYTLKFLLNQKESPPDAQGRTWPQFTMTPDGFTQQQILPTCKEMKVRAQFLAQAADSAEFANELAGADSDTGANAPAEIEPPPTATAAGGADFNMVAAATQVITTAPPAPPAPVATAQTAPPGPPQVQTVQTPQVDPAVTAAVPAAPAAPAAPAPGTDTQKMW